MKITSSVLRILGVISFILMTHPAHSGGDGVVPPISTELNTKVTEAEAQTCVSRLRVANERVASLEERIQFLNDDRERDIRFATNRGFDRAICNACHHPEFWRTPCLSCSITGEAGRRDEDDKK